MYPTDEARRGAMSMGREASLVLQIAQPIFDEQYEAAIMRAMNAYKTRELTETEAYAFVGQLTAIYDMQQELQHRVLQGNQAASEQHLTAEHLSDTIGR